MKTTHRRLAEHGSQLAMPHWIACCRSSNKSSRFIPYVLCMHTPRKGCCQFNASSTHAWGSELLKKFIQSRDQSPACDIYHSPDWLRTSGTTTAVNEPNTTATHSRAIFSIHLYNSIEEINKMKIK
ncbi:hypothetical protein OS493_008347 [Desmophyllum pertusum]|uniref:Uncharacterized protein n=1 Tax=Desmophyllum pertusum TaxID=174260 RepID=A0A9X0A3Z8_9CNID|nr:hypothetical protein OS493_008347 [Desmophyllum pertusum]